MPKYPTVSAVLFSTSQPEAILKLLQHTLHLMTGGTKGLDFFIPQWARPTRDWCKGDGSLDAELTDVDDPSWGVLRVVAWIKFTIFGCLS